MTAKTLRDFHAKRAGGRITAHGENVATGAQDKITNIDRIDPPAFPSDQHVLATDKHGIVHKLVFA